MDDVRFENCIDQWCKLIQEKSDGPLCLLMVICGRYEFEVTLPGVQIVYIPPKSNAKNHPLDLGIIATSKIRNRSSLLSATFNVLQGRWLSNYCLQSTTGHGKWRLEEGQLLRVADEWSCLTNHGHLFLKLQWSSAGSRVNTWVQCTSCTWILCWPLLPSIQQ